MLRQVQSIETRDDELFITNMHAETRVNHDGDMSQGLRVYKASPEHILVQIRSVGPTNGRYGHVAGVSKPAYSQVGLDRVGIDALIKHLEKLRGQLLKKP